MLSTILVFTLSLATAGAMPYCRYSANWGYGVAGGIGLVTMIGIGLLTQFGWL